MKCDQHFDEYTAEQSVFLESTNYNVILFASSEDQNNPKDL